MLATAQFPAQPCVAAVSAVSTARLQTARGALAAVARELIGLLLQAAFFGAVVVVPMILKAVAST